MTSYLDRILAIGLLLAASGAMSKAADAAGDPPKTCEGFASAIATAGRDGDLGGLDDLYRRVQDPALNCSGEAIACSGRAIALGFTAEAERLKASGAAPGDATAILLRGKAFGQPWQLVATLGTAELEAARAAHDANLYEAASKDLQEAMNATIDPPCDGETVATADDVEGLKRKAAEAGQLSAHFVVTPTRDGSCGGIFLSGERGLIGTTKTPVPIRFDYAEASLTTDGKDAATAMRDCIKEKRYTRIALSGHTDRKGSDAYNIALSQRRLEAVRDFLKAGGFAGDIQLLPKGKSEPFPLDDPGAHTQAEIDQADRRVEIRKVEP